MGAQELILPQGASRLRVSDALDGRGGIAVHVDSGMNSLAVNLDRAQQHMLLLYLKERLK